VLGDETIRPNLTSIRKHVLALVNYTHVEVLTSGKLDWQTTFWRATGGWVFPLQTLLQPSIGHRVGLERPVTM